MTCCTRLYPKFGRQELKTAEDKNPTISMRNSIRDCAHKYILKSKPIEFAGYDIYDYGNRRDADDDDDIRG